MSDKFISFQALAIKLFTPNGRAFKVMGCEFEFHLQHHPVFARQVAMAALI